MQESGLPSDQTSVVETQCGGHQGCTFGGIIFSMLYAKNTREFASCARSENLSFTLPFDLLGAPWPCSAHSMTHHVEIFDVEYVDDTMWAVREKHLQTSMKILTVCSRWLRPVFASTASH